MDTKFPSLGNYGLSWDFMGRQSFIVQKWRLSAFFKVNNLRGGGMSSSKINKMQIDYKENL